MENEKQKQSRRDFVRVFSIVALGSISLIVFLKNVLVYLMPSFKEKSYHKFLVGKENEIAIGKAKEITLGRKPAFLVHLDEGFKVISGVCTHLGCIIRWEEDKERFYCPCHNGVFDKSGQVTSGPPPRPLDEYKVEINDRLIFVYISDKKRGPWS